MKQTTHVHSKSILVEVHVHKLDDEGREEEGEREKRRGPSEAKLVLRGSRVEGQSPPGTLLREAFNAQHEQLQKPPR